MVTSRRVWLHLIKLPGSQPSCRKVRTEVHTHAHKGKQMRPQRLCSGQSYSSQPAQEPDFSGKGTQTVVQEEMNRKTSDAVGMEKLDLAGGAQNGDGNCRTLRCSQCRTRRWELGAPAVHGPWLSPADILMLVQCS